MAKVNSASTLNLQAYLTDRGRRFVFGYNEQGENIRFDNQGNDRFEIVEFSLYDADVNYDAFFKLESGDLPDVTGSNDNTLRTIINQNKKNKKKIFH